MPDATALRISNGNVTSPKQHHAVVMPLPGQGHINPLLHLSRTLASHYGFSITFVTLDYTHRLLLKSLQKEAHHAHEEASNTAAAAAKLDIKFVGIASGIPADASCTSDVVALCAGVLHSAPAFEQLLAELRPPPTCVISDIFVQHTQDAANKLGIPRVAFWSQSATCFATYLTAVRGGLFPSECEDGKLLIDNIAGAPSLRFKDLPSFLQQYKEPDFMYDFSVQPFTRLEEAHCVLMNSFDEMEAEALQALRQQIPRCRFFTIGPVLPPDYFSGNKLSNTDFNKTPGFWVEDYSCLEWLDGQQEGSVLYVSFGSIALLTEEELHEFALGLEATGFPVLWVLRPGVLEGGGHVSLPLGFEERTQGRVHIIDWSPQLHVLAHPSVGAFFTHGGWNSTLEGVSQGKPLLGFPYFADQMLNCRCIQDLWCNGLALERHGEGLLTRSLVEIKSRTLMSDPKLRESALLLRDSARRAILSTDQGSSSAQLHNFVVTLQ